MGSIVRPVRPSVNLRIGFTAQPDYLTLISARLFLGSWILCDVRTSNSRSPRPAAEISIAADA